MMKPNHTTRQSAALRCLAGIRPNELQLAADTLEKLQEHNFEVSSILNIAVAQYVCDRSSDFTLLSDKGLPRLRYRHTIVAGERSIVEQKAKALSDEGRVHCARVLDQQLSRLARVASSVRHIREGVSLTFPCCVEALRDAALLGLEVDARGKAVLQKERQGVKEIINLFRKYASELRDGNISQETTTSPTAQPLRSHGRNRLRVPAVPGTRRRWSHKPVHSKQPVQTVKTDVPTGDTCADAGMPNQPPSAEHIAFFHSWLTTDFGVKPAVADQLAPLFSMDAMENLVRAFEGIDRRLTMQLGARHPQIFHPRGDENWPTYAELLTEVTELVGGIHQVTQYLGKMEKGQTLKSLVKELKRRKQ